MLANHRNDRSIVFILALLPAGVAMILLYLFLYSSNRNAQVEKQPSGMVSSWKFDTIEIDHHMKITILTYGSRGDVQPFLALAIGLQKAGHLVNLAAPRRFESLVLPYGFQFTPLAGDPEVISQALNDCGRQHLPHRQRAAGLCFAHRPGSDPGGTPGAAGCRIPGAWFFIYHGCT